MEEPESSLRDEYNIQILETASVGNKTQETRQNAIAKISELTFQL